MHDLVEEVIDLVEEDAAALDCVDAVHRLRQIATDGTSALRQRKVAEDADTKAVVRHLIEEFGQDL